MSKLSTSAKFTNLPGSHPKEAKACRYNKRFHGETFTNLDKASGPK